MELAQNYSSSSISKEVELAERSYTRLFLDIFFTWQDSKNAEKLSIFLEF